MRRRAFRRQLRELPKTKTLPPRRARAALFANDTGRTRNLRATPDGTSGRRRYSGRRRPRVATRNRRGILRRRHRGCETPVLSHSLPLRRVGAGRAMHSCVYECTCTFVKPCVVRFGDMVRPWLKRAGVSADGCVFVREREREREREGGEGWNPPSTPPGLFVLLLVRGLSRPSKSISTPAPTSGSRIILKRFSGSHFGDSRGCPNPHCWFNPLSS